MKRTILTCCFVFVATAALALTEGDVGTLRALMDNAVQAKQIRDVPTNKVNNIIVSISGVDASGREKTVSINIAPSDTEFANALTAIKAVAGRRFSSYVAQMEALGVTVTP